MVRDMRWIGFLAVVCLAAATGCSDDDEPKTLGERVCASVQFCDLPGKLQGGVEGCARSLDEQLAAAPESCRQCIESLSCDQWEQTFEMSDVTTVTFCPTCGNS